ncbi:MAG: hypothetical protein Q9219_001580, partial [cf. Caloplaca sp. 3 TL-2023]
TSSSSSPMNIIYVSYTTSLHPPPGITTFILARGKSPETVKAAIASACSSSPHSMEAPSPHPPNYPSLFLKKKLNKKKEHTLLILTPLTPLLHSPPPANLPTYLLSLLPPQNPPTQTSSLLLIHHADIPLPLPHHPSSPDYSEQTNNPTPNPYAPSPLLLLRYTATTILTLRSLPHLLLQHRARSKAQFPPGFGLGEEREGVLVGHTANLGGRREEGGGGGLVLEMEHRRRSGRAVCESFFLPAPSSSSASGSSSEMKFPGNVVRLAEHPLFTVASSEDGEGKGEEEEEEEEGKCTFSLSITEAQRRVRDGVRLPYMDAQVRDGGGDVGGRGEGGRIVYEMGREDDFDEEEDEI